MIVKIKTAIKAAVFIIDNYLIELTGNDLNVYY